MGQNIRVITSSTDVIHSLSVPSLGFKIDCVPGRLNQIFFNIFKSSLYMGGCSEICGSGHGYMPTAIEGVSMGLFLDFISSFSQLEGDYTKIDNTPGSGSLSKDTTSEIKGGWLPESGLG